MANEPPKELSKDKTQPRKNHTWNPQREKVTYDKTLRAQSLTGYKTTNTKYYKTKRKRNSDKMSINERHLDNVLKPSMPRHNVSGQNHM